MPRHPLFKPYLALVAVCIFWGTTYLGIRMSLESFPPLMLVTVRYLISGTIMLLFAKVRGLHLPRGRELAAACFSGFLTLGIGNGALVFAEVIIPSGIAGLSEWTGSATGRIAMIRSPFHHERVSGAQSCGPA